VKMFTFSKTLALFNHRALSKPNNLN